MIYTPRFRQNMSSLGTVLQQQQQNMSSLGTVLQQQQQNMSSFGTVLQQQQQNTAKDGLRSVWWNWQDLIPPRLHVLVDDLFQIIHFGKRMPNWSLLHDSLFLF